MLFNGSNIGDFDVRSQRFTLCSVGMKPVIRPVARQFLSPKRLSADHQSWPKLRKHEKNDCKLRDECENFPHLHYLCLATCGPRLAAPQVPVRRRSAVGDDVYDSLREGAWCFLGQVVPDAALDSPM